MEEQTVMPVFYRVDPSDVRKQTGNFMAAFSHHEGNFKDKVASWRCALSQAGNLSGWDSSRIRPDSILVEKIVQDILERLKLASYSVSRRSLVGIDSRVEKVVRLLSIGQMSEFHMVGIWGMGGIGKTTIANEIYTQICSHFEGCCFLNNVRESALKGDLVHLRKKLFSKLLNEEVSDEGTPTIGSPFIQHRLQNKRVLVVLDDVNDPQHLDFLFGGLDHLGGPGSRVIITTRDRQVLNSCNIQAVYEVPKLDNDESFKLFCRHAFQHHLLKDLVGLSNKVIQYAQGVPLALVVLGSSLRGQDKKYWEGTLKKLKNVPNPKILDVLKVSYEGLDCEAKEIFLDIAFFFKGDKRDVITRVLDDEYFSIDSGITVLLDRSLITLEFENITMHDSLQEMGWDVARQESKNPKKRRRLCYPEDVRNLLARNEGSETIRGISLESSEMKELSLAPDAFAKMCNLKFLRIRCHTLKLPSDLQSLSDELRYISWVGYSLKSLPAKFCVEKLVKLYMLESSVEQLWSGTPNLASLQALDLAYSKNLKEIPDLSQAKNLEIMRFSECENLIEVPSSIKHLKKLVDLDLSGCVNLKKLPDSICMLESLEVLLLDDCPKLETFPDITETMKHLEMLGLEKTGIEVLPPSIELLEGLEYLGWTGGGDEQSLDLQVSQIPQGIGCLYLLEHLDLSGKNIETIPASLKQLSRLKLLNLNNCTKLQFLPDLPTQLEKLYAYNCTSLRVSSDQPFFIAVLFGYYVFIDCFELDAELIIQHVGEEYKKIFQQQDKQDLRGKFCISLPGNEVPEWFHHQSRGSSVIIQPSVYADGEPIISCWHYRSCVSEYTTLLYLRETDYCIDDEMVFEVSIRPGDGNILTVKSCGVHVLEGNPSISFNQEEVPAAKRLKRSTSS
ncbi:disease resistance protein TAO1-like isoform X2 [Carica papaya]|uniref:disease resistance protein TAO1-like isoform X2 n=1 Tax=Carica papaya TaxID=3649 RepID=UPI000B8CCBB7|nr:disease resistance protein TAO1-like isoform X2 [Carica papaya]